MAMHPHDNGGWENRNWHPGENGGAAEENGGSTEFVSCDLCGADDAALVETEGRFRMPVRNVVCRRCGLVYINPRMTVEGYTHFYAHDYGRLYSLPESPTPRSVKGQVKRGQAIASFLEPLLGRGQRMLDVGCAAGGILYVFRRRWGCEGLGIEPSGPYAEYGRRHFGLEIIPHNPGDPSFPDREFDSIILSRVLERFLSPSEGLLLMRRHLAPGGYLYIEVPNLRKPYGAITHFFQNAHPYTFSPLTLGLLLERTGYAIVRYDDSGTFMRVAARVLPGRFPRGVDPRRGDDWRAVLKGVEDHRRHRKARRAA
ncbi:MAG: class I SAM-dependent methyltransferase [Nitrospinota bacterium]